MLVPDAKVKSFFYIAYKNHKKYNAMRCGSSATNRSRSSFPRNSPVRCLDFEVEARTLYGIGTNLTIRYGYVFWVNGIALQRLFALQRTVEHHVGIR